MENELRSGRHVGYLFAIPCSIVSLAGIFFSTGNPGLWFLSLLFGLGAAVGFYLILNPPTLVRVNHGLLELYPGSLFRNTPKIALPLNRIEHFEVQSISDDDGNTWLLSLHLREPHPIPETAKAWVKSIVPKDILKQTDDTTIHWCLSWPEGGTQGAQTRLKKLIGSQKAE